MELGQVRDTIQHVLGIVLTGGATAFIHSIRVRWRNIMDSRLRYWLVALEVAGGLIVVANGVALVRRDFVHDAVVRALQACGCPNLAARALPSVSSLVMVTFFLIGFWAVVAAYQARMAAATDLTGVVAETSGKLAGVLERTKQALDAAHDAFVDLEAHRDVLTKSLGDLSTRRQELESEVRLLAEQRELSQADVENLLRIVDPWVVDAVGRASRRDLLFGFVGGVFSSVLATLVLRMLGLLP